ncbi:hypothetical protein ACFRAM_11395 [Paenibacillus sp. NPDC056722]|uniref:hypothetical protein n=1 Tax=Paenibacillus sp. NPDC056722 TaxID=3345924 RepID=UPI003691A418
MLWKKWRDYEENIRNCLTLGDVGRISGMVREELAALRSDVVTFVGDSQKIGRAAIKIINEIELQLGKAKPKY